MIGDLERVHFQSTRFRRKLAHTLGTVAAALQQAQRPYVAFSGGKDSVAVAGLVHKLAPNTPLLWSDDELEYPETVAYMTNLSAIARGQLIVTLGFAEHAGWFFPWRDAPFWREPLPGSLRINCAQDDWQAEMGCDLTFLGLRMAENRRRRDWLIRTGPLYRSKTGTGWRCAPLLDWTADDVWALIVGWGLAYNPVYDRLEEISVPRHAQRLGPLPLARRQHLADGWPDLLAKLEARYGKRWT